MVKTRTIVKNCPKCQSRVAVASKACKCGYSFFNAKKPTQDQQPDGDERRRTARVRREKPNFYNSQEFEKKKKKKDKRATAVKRKLSQEDTNEDKNSKESTAARANRRRQRKEDEHAAEDLCSKLSTDRQQLANIILSELNRKIGSVMWNPT